MYCSVNVSKAVTFLGRTVTLLGSFGTGRPLPSWASLVMVALRGAQSCEHIYKAILPSRKTGMGKGGEEGGGRERVAENRNLLGPSPTSPMQHSRKSNGRP